MTDSVGCGDNSCIFKVLRPSGGMGTNGGCRCFKNLICWIQYEGEGRWNRDEVRGVEQDTQRLAHALREAQAENLRLREALERIERITPTAMCSDLLLDINTTASNALKETK